MRRGALMPFTSRKEIVMEANRNDGTAKQARGAVEQTAGNERPCRYFCTDAFITEI